METILDFSLDNVERMLEFEKFCKDNNENISFELVNRLNGIYQFSGMKILQDFLYNICFNISILSMLKFKASQGLLLFDEFEEEFEKDDDEGTIKCKKESNIEIHARNNKRKDIAYEALNNVCLTSIEDLPTPCRVDSVLTLMDAGDRYKIESDIYFRKIINDMKIECDYRYKTILLVETKEKLNFKYYIKNSCLDFLFNTKNFTMYRILSAQYLLKHIELEEDERIKIQEIILSLSQDNELDYDLRADAADLLLNLGTDKYKTLGREIIQMLGRIDGNVKTIYDNKQNVHTEEIEKSILNIIEILSSYPTLKVNENEINLIYVKTQIDIILKEQKLKPINNDTLLNEHINYYDDYFSGKINCKNCNNYIGCIYTTNIRCLNCEEDNKDCKMSSTISTYCSTECEQQFTTYNKIYLSLNRIEIDRSTYLGNSLSRILVKIWSYIQVNEFKDELIKRLLQELEEMSGTCSSGFVGRLINTLSGFSDLTINISFEDQLISNFIGRLNSYTRKITDISSPFYKDRLYDVLELMLRNMDIPKNKAIKLIIDEHLEKKREEKIDFAIEYFSEQVINEMTVNSNEYNDRRHFLLFFRTYLPFLREELYEEFKEYLSVFEFDLTIRKAISLYEGTQHFV